jgi:ABC-type transport system involved in multi-copper enzyme maturation permease subunit
MVANVDADDGQVPTAPSTGGRVVRDTLMFPGPVFHAELVTSARRKRFYVTRFLYGFVLLFFVWRNDPLLYPWYYSSLAKGLTIQEYAELGRGVFTTFLTVQSIAVLVLIPALVAGVIADEKQRKTLHYLLASPLSSAEIIVGKLTARVLHIATYIALGVPILSIVMLFGGVDPLLVWLTFVLTISTMCFLATLAILVSVYARRPREAISAVYLFEFLWLFAPPMIALFMPRGGAVWGQVYEWIRPVNSWIAPSSPFYLLMSGPIGLSAKGTIDMASWMVGLQALYGAGFLALAIARLRAVVRKEGEGVRTTRWSTWFYGKGTFLAKPVCGDDPMLWKERFVARSSLATKAVTGLVVAAALCALGYLTYEYAWSAFVEIGTHGYGSTVAGGARHEFNTFLRIVETLIFVLWILGVASTASAGLTGEREQDTWLSLVATPLGGWEIIRAKMFGSLWGFRWLAPVYLALLGLGIASGSVHPVGGVAVVVETAVYLWFATALGTWISLRSRKSSRSLVATLGVLIVVNGGYMVCCIPWDGRTSLVAAGVMPAIEVGSLMRCDEVHWFLGGDRDYALTGFVSVLFYATAAALLTRNAVERFEREVGRPMRADSPRRVIDFEDAVGDDEEIPTGKPKA